MKPSNKGSRKFDIVVDFVSWKEENKKELAVETAGEKDNILSESKEIPTGNSKIYENGNVETENGNIIINFGDFQIVKNNNENRPTEHSIDMAKQKGIEKNFMKEKAKREGNLVEFNEEKKRRKQKDIEQVM